MGVEQLDTAQRSPENFAKKNEERKRELPELRTVRLVIKRRNSTHIPLSFFRPCLCFLIDFLKEQFQIHSKNEQKHIHPQPHCRHHPPLLYSMTISLSHKVHNLPLDSLLVFYILWFWTNKCMAYIHLSNRTVSMP